MVTSPASEPVEEEMDVDGQRRWAARWMASRASFDTSRSSVRTAAATVAPERASTDHHNPVKTLEIDTAREVQPRAKTVPTSTTVLWVAEARQHRRRGGSGDDFGGEELMGGDGLGALVALGEDGGEHRLCDAEGNTRNFLEQAEDARSGGKSMVAEEKDGSRTPVTKRQQKGMGSEEETWEHIVTRVGQRENSSTTSERGHPSLFQNFRSLSGLEMI